MTANDCPSPAALRQTVGVGNARELITGAFARLHQLKGFVPRPDQEQLALVISDCIEGSDTGLIEAPTGLGKSIAALIPSFAHAVSDRKRIAIATFTNVLAEQYWRTEVPLAASLFDETPSVKFLIGRQRYACISEIENVAPRLRRDYLPRAELGIETEFRNLVKMSAREQIDLWNQISAPPVCPARLCPHYEPCLYYRARRAAERAHVIITNHSVILQDAILREISDGRQSLLGDLDYLIIDEAHDFPQATQGALEFELSEMKLAGLSGIVNRMEQTALALFAEFGSMADWANSCETLRNQLSDAQNRLRDLGYRFIRSGILAAAPEEVWQFPTVKRAATLDCLPCAQQIADHVRNSTRAFLNRMERQTSLLRNESEDASGSIESLANYAAYLSEYASQCERLFEPQGVSVTYIGDHRRSTFVRSETLDISEPLKKLLWEKTPSVCLSATLAIDGDFDWFRRTTGIAPRFQEIFHSAFDYQSKCALYLPPTGAVPDPTQARKIDMLDSYYDGVAAEVSKIIAAMGGRTLVLFHSREEMEQVHSRVRLPENLPVVMQRKTGAAASGEKFKRHVSLSLFGLRSFWTGFDAPGETASCVVLVRIPFEVPTDPPSIARNAWVASRGLDPFATHTLPMAKMMVRQGAGRLLRNDSDRGVIAILDPRLRTKAYGEQIASNLPHGIRAFCDIHDAVAHAGVRMAED